MGRGKKFENPIVLSGTAPFLNAFYSPPLCIIDFEFLIILTESSSWQPGNA